jgi:FkbM family methyltransferase
MASYQSALLGELSRSRFSRLEGNYDPELGVEPPPPPELFANFVSYAKPRLEAARRSLQEALEPVGLVLSYYLFPRRYFRKLAEADLQRGEYLYGRLADAKSKALLVKLAAFRVLGHRKVKLPRNTAKYWATLEEMKRHITTDPALPIKFNDRVLPVYDARQLGYDMRVHTTDLGIAYALCQKQYEYHGQNVRCKVEPGDVVIDAGACWGETAMYFAHEAGPSGACLSFEFIPSNLDVLQRNLVLNPHLADRVRVVPRPLWSASGRELFYVDWGPGSRVSPDPAAYSHPDGKTVTTTIDEALAAEGLDRVDFIKMDIEGAELDALRGAEASIRKHRPKLAISVYHRPEDFADIPRYIDSLGLGYTFYLEHHTLYQNETVLFAVPPWRPDRPE